MPCALLLFTDPAAFAALLVAPAPAPAPAARPGGSSNGGGGGGSAFDALLRRAAALHPDRSLQAVVVGLEAHLRARARREMAAGAATAGAEAARAAALRLQLAVPALQLRAVPNEEAAALHLLSLTRALGEQPYKRAAARDDALAAGRAGASFEAAAASGMDAELPPGARRAARCLARVPGLGGGQVWAIFREHGGLGALTQAFLSAQAAGRDPASVVSELRGAVGARRRLGTALGARLAALLTSTDPDELVCAGAAGE